jgi:hypothetical protein
MMEGINRPGSPFIILEFLIENIMSDTISKEISQPKEEEIQPRKPKRDTLSHMCLELN